MAELFKYARLYQNLFHKIKTGVFRPGDKLPSIRQLSRQMGVALITVQRAYGELESIGLLESRPKSGYFVVPSRQNELPRNPLRGPYVRARPADLTMDVVRYNRDPRLVQFGGATLSVELLPVNELSKVLRRVLSQSSGSKMLYEPMGGTLELRRQIERRIFGEEVLITVGGTEAIQLALRSCTKPGDSVAVESPTYFGLLGILESLGLRAVEVPTDSATGIRTGFLIPLIESKKIQACVLIPHFQNPTGSLIPDDQKREIVFAAEKADIPLIELETSRELYFEGSIPKMMAAYSRKGQVLSCGSFSKLTAPGFRVGYLIGGRYHARAQNLKRNTTLATPTIEQLVLAQFIQFGLYDRHLAKLRSFFKLRNSRLQDAVLRAFPKGTRVNNPRGGYLLWVELPDGKSSKELFNAAIEKGISISPGDLFSTSGRYDHFFRLNCSVPENPRSDRALQTLAEIAHRI